jgi:hypothetical protein
LRKEGERTRDDAEGRGRMIEEEGGTMNERKQGRKRKDEE